MKLRILVVSQYFPPDMGAPAGRFYDFAQHWIAAGHAVTVVTGFPHFPGGVAALGTVIISGIPSVVVATGTGLKR